MNHINHTCTCKGFECTKCKVFQCLGHFTPGDHEQCRRCKWAAGRARLQESCARALAAEARRREIINLQDQALLIKPNGTEQEIQPANGQKFTRMEIYRLLGEIPTYSMHTGNSYIYVGEDNLFAGEDMFTILECTQSRCKYIRDGRIFTFDVAFNEKATQLWDNEKHRLHGNVVVIPVEQDFD